MMPAPAPTSPPCASPPRGGESVGAQAAKSASDARPRPRGESFWRCHLISHCARWDGENRARADSVTLSSHYASQTRPAPPRTRPGSLLGVDADPVPTHPAPAGSARSSLNPRARLLEVRTRGLSDVLAGRVDTPPGLPLTPRCALRTRECSSNRRSRGQNAHLDEEEAGVVILADRGDPRPGTSPATR